MTVEEPCKALEVVKGNALYSEIFNRLRNERNWTCTVVGPTGSGKSFASMRLAYDLDLDEQGNHRFNLSRVCFTIPQFLDLLRGKDENKLPAGSFVILDEAALSLNSQKWYELSSQVMSAVNQSFRFRNLGVLYTFPGGLDFLNKQVRVLCHSALVMESVNIKGGYSWGKFKDLQVNELSGKLYKKTPIKESEDGDSPIEGMKFYKPPQHLVDEYLKTKEIYLQGFYEQLAGQMQAVTSASKKVDLKELYSKALENPLLYMSVKKFEPALLRVQLSLNERNAATLARALNLDLKAKRIKL